MAVVRIGPLHTGEDPGAAGLGAASGELEDRVLVYPWLELDSVEDSFAETWNEDQMGRTEDRDLGRSYHARLGLSSGIWGATRDALIFDLAARMGWRPAAGDNLTVTTSLSGRWAAGPENALLTARGDYHRRNLGRHLFFATLQADLARSLDPENQLLLGGDSGLRGYPLRFQSGDARVLATAEERFFTDFYPLRLVHVGAAVFADVGRTWQDGSPGAGDLGLLRDVGFGLRLGSGRSALGSVIHLDLAFPLDGGGAIDRVQWLIESKASL